MLFRYMLSIDKVIYNFTMKFSNNYIDYKL